MFIESDDLCLGFFPEIRSGFMGPDFVLKIFDSAKVLSLFLDNLVVLLDIGEALVE